MSNATLATQLATDLRALANPEKAAFFPQFFQAFPGGYGEGDCFLGVTVPNIRTVAKNYSNLDRSQLLGCLRSPWHECRMAGLFVLLRQFELAKKQPVERQAIVDFYIEQLDYVNNWDLVDCSAYKILGVHLVSNPQQSRILHELAKSKHLWRERVAVVATLAQIRSGEYTDLLQLAEKFLTHRHDLIHKAVGWMLREMGQRNETILRAFLDQYAFRMPRTMLRYALEKFEPLDRQRYLKLTGGR
ncbi:MAG: DNA alkylation repair protein [Planctomycetaceae bacterium]|nr:DNA alkylation repair protein [Planctomycetaceae bacterium]